MLVIQATNFTAEFSKLGYFGIKGIMDKVKVNYSCVSIIQASNLKEILEELELNRYGVTISSVDAINMYPSIKLATTKKVVILFARKLNASTKNTIHFSLMLIQFGMSSNLISFDGEYYKYHGGKKEEQGLSIGGYK